MSNQIDNHENAGLEVTPVPQDLSVALMAPARLAEALAGYGMTGPLADFLVGHFTMAPFDTAAKLDAAIDADDADVDARLAAWSDWKETLASVPREQALEAISTSLVNGLRVPNAGDGAPEDTV